MEGVIRPSQKPFGIEMCAYGCFEKRPDSWAVHGPLFQQCPLILACCPIMRQSLMGPPLFPGAPARKDLNPIGAGQEPLTHLSQDRILRSWSIFFTAWYAAESVGILSSG